MTPSELVALGMTLEEMERPKAKERMVAGVADPTQKSAGGETRDALAKMAGVSHDTFTKAEYVDDHASEGGCAGGSRGG